MKIDKDYIKNLYEINNCEDFNAIINAVYALDCHDFINKEALIEVVKIQQNHIDMLIDYINDEANRVKGFQY